jgi:Protein of unknown function DUF262
MSTTTYTFWNLLEKYPLQVPPIQRDYAQGRTDTKTTLIREKLVTALREALTEPRPLRLDFVYGSLPEDTFVPLDGQQRLTTLFLLHWYLAYKEQQLGAVRERLGRFGYATRSSSRAFCRELVAWEPTGLPDAGQKLSERVQDAAWFQPAWLFDPTVQGMLTMLDELALQFGPTSGLLDRLRAADCPVDFYFLDMDKVALTDDLYLKMNARGKALTNFENWRAAFDLYLQQQHPARTDFQADFGVKLDGKWLDFFWEYRDMQTALTDRAGENTLSYLTRMLGYGVSLGLKEFSALQPVRGAFVLPFSLFEQVYAAPEQVEFLFGSLDFLARLEKEPQGADGWLGTLLTDAPTLDGRVRLFGEEKPDLIRQVLEKPEPTIKAQVMLMAVVAYGVARTGTLDLDDLRDLMRVVRNILERERQQNDTAIRPDMRYSSLHVLVPVVRRLAEAVAVQGNTYAVLAAQGEQLLAGLTANVRNHEQQKANLIVKREEQKLALQQLEDMSVLRGDLHNLPLSDSTVELAAIVQVVTELWLGNVAQEAIIGAWLAQGEYWVYGGGTGWGSKYFFGNRRNWYTVLAADEKKVAEALPDFLAAYQHADGITPEERLAALRQEWLATVPKDKDWRYYFVAYPEMTQGSRAYFAGDGEYDLHLLEGDNLKARHINPYVRTVLRRGLIDDLVQDEDSSWVNDKYPTPLLVEPFPPLPAGVDGPKLYCEEDGWRLELASGCQLTTALEELYALQPDAEGLRWLQATPEQDRIERVEAFVQDLHQHGLLYEPIEEEKLAKSEAND